MRSLYNFAGIENVMRLPVDFENLLPSKIASASKHGAYQSSTSPPHHLSFYQRNLFQVLEKYTN